MGKRKEEKRVRKQKRRVRRWLVRVRRHWGGGRRGRPTEAAGPTGLGVVFVQGVGAGQERSLGTFMRGSQYAEFAQTESWRNG